MEITVRDIRRFVDKRGTIYYYHGSDGNGLIVHSALFTTALAPDRARARLVAHFKENGYLRGRRGELFRVLPGDFTTLEAGVAVDDEPQDGRYAVDVTVLERR